MHCIILTNAEKKQGHAIFNFEAALESKPDRGSSAEHFIIPSGSPNVSRGTPTKIAKSDILVEASIRR
jgi:hypothetical protein